MCSPPATRTRARLRRRTELESMQSPAGSAATAPQSPNMAAPAAVSHIVPIGVFNTRLAVSFLAFLWAVCLTPVLFDGSAYTVSTMGDKLTRGMRRLDPRVRQASELRDFKVVLDEIIQLNTQLADSAQFLHNDDETSHGSALPESHVGLPAERAVDQKLQGAVEISEGCPSDLQAKLISVEANLLNAKSQHATQLEATQRQLQDLAATLTTVSRERDTMRSQVQVLQADKNKILEEWVTTKEQLASFEMRASQLGDQSSGLYSKLQACQDANGTAYARIASLAAQVTRLEKALAYQQTIVESARTLWSRVCAIGRRFAGDAMMQASSGMDTAMHTMRNAQEVLTKLGADAWPALSRTGNSLRQSLAIWVTQVAGRDMASALATYLNCVWQRVQACISHLDADLECAKGEPLRAPLWLLGACMLILATYMALSKRTWAVSTAQATFMQKEDATSSAQLPCQPLATPCCDHVESDRRPATPSTPCTPEMPSQQPKCAVTPEIHREKLRQLNARCFDLESEVDWLRLKLEETEAALQQNTRGRWAEATAESAKLMTPTCASMEKKTPGKSPGMAGLLAVTPATATEQKGSQDEDVPGTPCETPLPSDVGELRQRLRHAEICEAQAVEELASRVGAQAQLERAVARHLEEHDRIEKELLAYREHADELEEQLAAQSREVETLHAQMDWERHTFQGHITALSAEAARMHSLREYVEEMQEMADIMDDIMAASHCVDDSGEDDSLGEDAISSSPDRIEGGSVSTAHPHADHGGGGAASCSPVSEAALHARVNEQSAEIHHLHAESAEWAEGMFASSPQMEAVDARVAGVQNSAELHGSPNSAREALQRKRAELDKALRRENTALQARITYLEHRVESDNHAHSSTLEHGEQAAPSSSQAMNMCDPLIMLPCMRSACVVQA
mmetsp:Transcript_985/g.2467  ORF Transcript_985/g.2467 Transcript_985/m.2467 type:complete len:915 (-) Transcript_985:1186-3930(-)